MRDLDTFGLLSLFPRNSCKKWSQLILGSKIIIWDPHGLLVICSITWTVKETKLIFGKVIKEEDLEREADTKWRKKLIALKLQFFHDAYILNSVIFPYILLRPSG